MRGKEASHFLKHSHLQNALNARLRYFKRKHLWLKPTLSPTSLVLQSFVLSQQTHTLHTITEHQETNPGIMDPVDIIASLRHTSQLNWFEVYVVEVKPKEVFNNYGSQNVYPPLHYGNSLRMFHYGSPMIPTPLGPQPLMGHPTTAMKGPCVNAELIYQANVRATNQAITGLFQPPVPNFPAANVVQHHEGVSGNVVAASRVGGSGFPKEFYLMYLKTIMSVDMERNAMVLPKKFAALALPLESSDVKLVDSDGTKWPCYIHWET